MSAAVQSPVPASGSSAGCAAPLRAGDADADSNDVYNNEYNQFMVRRKCDPSRSYRAKRPRGGGDSPRPV